MRRDALWLLMATALPLFLIFLLPVFGVLGQTLLLTLIIIFFAFHFLFLSFHPCSERLMHYYKMLKRTQAEGVRTMMALDIKKYGLAWGSACAILYLGCVIVMAVAGREGTVFLFNSLLHGLDVSPVIRMSMPVSEMVTGLIEIFIVGWLFGATIASIYNYCLKGK
jgi:hypothetical protein